MSFFDKIKDVKYIDGPEQFLQITNLSCLT